MAKTLEQMKAELETIRAEAVAKIQEAKEKAQIMTEVTQLRVKMAMSSDAMVQAKVQSDIKREASDKLKELNLACETIVNEMPIFNARTKENRKWNPSRQYGLGNQVAALTGLLSGIQYAALDHKTQMLAVTGLDEDLIESTLAAFGSLPYYNRNYAVVVEGTPFDLETLQVNLALVQDALGITIDTSAVTEANMTHRMEAAQLRAEKQLEEEALAADMRTDSIIA